jgi:HK97 family phage portal protein
MAIWDRLLKRVISPVVNESIKELSKPSDDDITKILVANTATSRLTPVSTGVPTIYKQFPSGVDFNTLRNFSYYYPPLRSCINYRKRQISQLDWDVAPRKVIKDKTKKKAADEKAEVIKTKLRYPAGDKSMTMRSFIHKVLEDLLVLDACAIYKRQRRGGGLYGYLPIDPTTIEMILNEDGTVPQPPKVAYQQKVKGEIVERLTTDQMIYGMMNPRTETPYGMSPVETLILTVTSALKLTSYNLAYLTEGNIPEGFVELPKDVANNPEQLKLWQEAWDAMFAGDVRFQRKVKFLPEGMQWHTIRKAEDMEFERFEKWLLLNTCSVMEVAPQAIGFQFERGKGATETEWEIGKERGLFPTALFLKEMFDIMIQEDFGETEFNFIWTNINPTNKKEEADVFGQLVRTGAVSVDEWRIAEGFDPIGLEQYIMTPVGPVLVKDFVKMSEEGANPFIPNYGGGQQGPARGEPAGALPGKKPQTESQDGKKPGANTAVSPKEPITPGAPKNPVKMVKQKLNLINKEEVVKELKTWKKAASNDIKSDRGFRDFKTDVIDDRTQSILKEGLKTVKSKKDLDDLFNPFINQENRVISSMLDLYEDVSNIVEYGDNKVKENQVSY